ncbi:MAG: hypothetical protein K5776_10640 [Lachnospiraceae bacterium]|nr:hypothetical protein [Lachnospiraceae bacterium]
MLKNKMRKAIALFTGVLSAFVMINSTGCKKQEVEYYPEVVVDENDNTQKDTSDGKVDDGNEVEDEEAALFMTYDSIANEGKFVFNTSLIHPVYREAVRENPKLLKVAQKVLDAIYECKDSVELTEEEEITVAEQGIVENLIYYSSPVVTCVNASLDESNSNVINLVYFADYARSAEEGRFVSRFTQEESKERMDQFKDYVSKTINDNIKPEHTSEERARIIYEALIKDLTVAYPDPDDGGLLEYFDQNKLPEGSVADTPIEQILEKKVEPFELIRLYDFFLAQLNVNCVLVGARGHYQKQEIQKLDDLMEGCMIDMWPIVVIDDETAYNCDILFDKIAYDDEFKGELGEEPDPLYFGMSDTARNKSLNIIGKRAVFSVTPTQTPDLPLCDKDYKK